MMIKLIIFTLIVLNLYAAEASVDLNSDGINIKVDPNDNSKATFISGIHNRSSCMLECPPLKPELFGRIADTNLRTGVTTCYIYNKKEPSKLLGTAVNTNTYCIDRFDYKLTQADYNSLGIKENTAADKGALTFQRYSDLAAISDKYFVHYGDTANKQFINMPKYMIASLTVDSEIIDVSNTIKYNELTLQPKFTLYPNASTNSEQAFDEQFKKDNGWISSKVNKVKNFFGYGQKYDESTSNGANPNITGDGIDTAQVQDSSNIVYSRAVSSVKAVLSSSVIFIINFLNEYNDEMLMTKTYLLFTILPFTLLFAVGSKTTKFLSKISDHDDVAERIVVGVATVFIFYLSSTNIKTIDDMKISQSNFQNWFRPIMYKGAEVADLAAKSASRAYIYTKLRNVGLAPQDVLSDTYRELERTKKEQQILTSIKGECYGSYNTEKMREIIGSRLGLNQTFPQTENLIVKGNKIFGDTNLNFYTTGEYGFLQKQEYQTQNNMFSASACYKNERELQLNTEKIAKYENLLAMNKSAVQDDVLHKQIDMIANMQFRNVAELGFVAMPMLATTSVMIDNTGIFNNPDNQRTDEKLRERILNDYRSSGGVEIGGLAEGDGIIDMPINWFISNSPILIFPGADSVKGFYTDLIKGSSDSDGKPSSYFMQLIGSAVSKVPGVGMVVSWLASGVGDVISTGIVLALTIVTMLYIVSFLPLVALAGAAFMVIFFYFFSVEVYYLVAPFLIAFAFSTGSLEIIKNFMKTGVILAFKPLLIVLSIVLALFAKDFFEGINFVLVNWQFDQMFALTQLEGEKALQSIANGEFVMAKESTLTYLFSDIGLIWFRGFLLIGNSAIAIMVVFYLVLQGANMILDLFGIRDANVDVQSSLGQNIDGKTSKWNVAS